MNSLNSSQKRLVKDRYDSFVRQGAKLNDKDKAVLSQKNAALAGLFAEFSQKVLSDEEGYITWIDDTRNVGDGNISSSLAFADNIFAKADMLDALGGIGGRPVDTCLIIIVDDCVGVS